MGMTAVSFRRLRRRNRPPSELPAELPEFIEGNQWAHPVPEVRPKGILGWFVRLTPMRLRKWIRMPSAGRRTPVADSRPHLHSRQGVASASLPVSETAWEGDEPGCYLVEAARVLPRIFRVQLDSRADTQ